MGKANVIAKRRQRSNFQKTTIFLTTDLTRYAKMISLVGFVCFCCNILYWLYANGEIYVKMLRYFNFKPSFKL